MRKDNVFFAVMQKKSDFFIVFRPKLKRIKFPVPSIMELKILRRSLERTIEDGLRQTVAYMDIAGSVDEGHLIIFDRSQTRSWDERIWHRPYEQDGRTIMVWGM